MVECSLFIARSFLQLLLFLPKAFFHSVQWLASSRTLCDVWEAFPGNITLIRSNVPYTKLMAPMSQNTDKIPVGLTKRNTPRRNERRPASTNNHRWTTEGADEKAWANAATPISMAQAATKKTRTCAVI